MNGSCICLWMNTTAWLKIESLKSNAFKRTRAVHIWLNFYWLWILFFFFFHKLRNGWEDIFKKEHTSLGQPTHSLLFCIQILLVTIRWIIWKKIFIHFCISSTFGCVYASKNYTRWNKSQDFKGKASYQHIPPFRKQIKPSFSITVFAKGVLLAGCWLFQLKGKKKLGESHGNELN